VNSAIEAILQKLPDHKKVGEGKWRATCPAHNDQIPSLSIACGDDGRVLLKCHAGCSVDEVCSALEIAKSELFEKSATTRRTSSRKGDTYPQASNATVQPQSGCTLKEYATVKHLPEDFLTNIGLRQITYQRKPAVRIPYGTTNGTPGPIRFRLSMKGSRRFVWKSGSKVILYGLDQFDEIKRFGYVILVEGESDCHTLWYHGEPALGIAGASNWRDTRDVQHCIHAERIYVVMESDSGGESLIKILSNSLLMDRIYVIRLHPLKDVSDLHVSDPDRFRERWKTALDSANPLSDEIRREAEQRQRQLEKNARELIEEKDILARFARTFEQAGVVGEERNGKLLYLAVTSRLLNNPVSAVVKGPSSGGKSFTTQKVLEFFPKSAFYALTAMSERALAYSQEPIQHRTIVMYEAAGLTGEFGTYLIRSLLSEGRIRYETVEKTKNGLESRFIEREGPTNLIVTTTAIHLHPENETRLISLQIIDSAKQTAEIMLRMAQDKVETVQFEVWHDFQEYLQGCDNRVAIPYAKSLARNIPAVAIRLRRDFAALLVLICSHAILHQGTRKRDEQGRIVAELEDYTVVRERDITESCG